MASQFSVIQYVPDPIADERINIGVLAFDDNVTRVKFLSHWERVRCFDSSQDLSFLKSFAARMEHASLKGLLYPGDEDSGLSRKERLVKVSREWANSIQFTEPAGSLEPVDDLLLGAADDYLIEPPVKEPKKLRDRQGAAQVVAKQIKDLLYERFDETRARKLLKTKYSLEGSDMVHKFDVAVANGTPFFALHGISFEVNTPETTVGSVAYMLIDTIKAKPTLPIAVIALPPTIEGLFKHISTLVLRFLERMR
jgi:Protein of unknown function (DUF3037)